VAPRWSSTTVWITAAVTALLFFVTLLLHELAHSLVAKTRGLRVSAITLFALLGGVSQTESEASDAKSEFRIAISGPLTSLAIGLALLGAARASAWVPGTEPRTAVTSVLVWLGYINLTLAVFNMIPGYPLDGGRVLRAIVWWITGDADRSTRLATQVGQAIAFFFILLGLFRFFVGANFGGLYRVVPPSCVLLQLRSGGIDGGTPQPARRRHHGTGLLHCGGAHQPATSCR